MPTVDDPGPKSLEKLGSIFVICDDDHEHSYSNQQDDVDMSLEIGFLCRYIQKC